MMTQDEFNTARANYQKVHEIIIEFFDNNKLKAHQWMTAKNPMLGGLSPDFMIMSGRGKKLLQIIRDAKDGTFP